MPFDQMQSDLFLRILSSMGFPVHTIIETISIVAAILAIFMLLNCFLGYKLLKFYITLTGFLIGIILSIPVSFIVGMVFRGGVFFLLFLPVMPILCAWLAFKVYKVGIFIYCGTLPALLGFLIGFLTAPPVGMLLALFMFILFGTLGVLLSRPYVIAITAIPSGLSAGPLLLTALQIHNSGGSLLLGAVLATAGVIVQWKTTGVSPKQAKNSWPQPVASTAGGTARFCRNCGSPLTPGASFCRTCGAKVATEPTASAAPQVSEPPAPLAPEGIRPGEKTEEIF